MKNLLKHALYKVFPPRFRAGYTLSLGFIFHTEQLYNTHVFEKLIEFCEQFRKLTGKRPLCVVMSPVNKRVASELLQHHFSLDQFVDRLKTLADAGDIGYHGHFWRNSDDFENPSNQIRHRNYSPKDDSQIGSQFQHDYLWLNNTTLCKPVYAAGWWFINPAVIQQLMDHGVHVDFSFTRMHWVDNPWVKDFLEQNKIGFGESFMIQQATRSLHCIQTVMGCPNTGFPGDFVRIVNSHLDSNRDVCGMIATHDYNLTERNNLKHALELIAFLVNQPSVTFYSADELAGMAKPNKKIQFESIG